MQKVGRNDPCPCGSGKKYKKCCLRESYSPRGREESTSRNLVENILAFSKKYHGDAIEEAYDYFWDDFDPDEYLDANKREPAQINFLEWFIYDWQVDEKDKKTPIDLYMENTRRLSSEEITVLEKMKEAVLSLYEVQEVFPEKGLLLKDLLLGGEYEVKEKQATRSLRKWDIFTARLLHFDNIYIMSGGAYAYPIPVKEKFVKNIMECFKDYRKDHPGGDLRDFLKRNGDLFNHYWCEIIREPLLPTLVTRSGEPFLFTTAVFDITDEEGAVGGLRKLDDMEEAENGLFYWLDERDSHGSATILGTIRLKSNTLKLECRSKERLEKGKALILENLADSVTHKVDMFQDPYQAMKDWPKASAKADSGISPEEKQMFYEQYMRNHYEGWLNDKLPALKGKTPLEAVKSRRGKESVTEILKSIENTEEHNKRLGEPHFDISWLWERLGLER